MISQVYLEYSFLVKPLSLGNEILIAELGYVGFESFVEDYQGLKAYIQKKEWNENILEEIQILNSNEFKITYSFKEIEQVNWNEAWEKNFHPIEVDKKCVVRAPFHPKANVDYEIVIEPKMSFGTGHHETTSLVMNEMFGIDFTDKSVLDMGSGTGVLAILAAKLGATSLVGIDFNEWAYENAVENAKINAISTISFMHGDADAIGDATFDVILANINRNIILQDIATYIGAMNTTSEILFSGFLKEDIPLILEKSEQLGLELVVSKHKNKWQMLHLKKA